MYIRERPDTSADRIGVLTHNQTATYTGNQQGNFIEVTFGDITGWVWNYDNLLSGVNLQNYIKSNLDDFDIEVRAKKTVGVYETKDAAQLDKLKYTTKATIKKGTDITFYKTPVLKQYIPGLSYFEDYIHISRNLKISEYKKSGKIRVKKGDEYRLVNEEDDCYIIEKNQRQYLVPKSDGVIVDKEEKVSNIASIPYANNTMYSVNELDNGVAEIKINNKTYYTSINDLYVFYIPDVGSLAYNVVNSNTSFTLDKLGKDVLKVGVANKASDTVLTSYVDRASCDLLVDFEEADEFEEPVIEEPVTGDSTFGESEETYNGANKANLKYTVSESVYKDRYTYEYDNSSTDERNEVINYALQFLGRPYVYGGTSLEHGIDCSAFVQQMLQHFGYPITRTTHTQVADGYGRIISPDEIQPGDLIYYTRDGRTTYHVVMYLGGNKCVNASCQSLGVCISDVLADRVYCVKNYID